MVEIDHTSWYFKVTVGERVDSKIRPVQNCLVKCNITTSCSDVKEALSREVLVQPANIVLYDNDFLEISDSPGRVGENFVMLFLYRALLKLAVLINSLSVTQFSGLII